MRARGGGAHLGRLGARLGATRGGSRGIESFFCFFSRAARTCHPAIERSRRHGGGFETMLHTSRRCDGGERPPRSFVSVLGGLVPDTPPAAAPRRAARPRCGSGSGSRRALGQRQPAPPSLPRCDGGAEWLASALSSASRNNTSFLFLFAVRPSSACVRAARARVRARACTWVCTSRACACSSSPLPPPRDPTTRPSSGAPLTRFVRPC